ncbi:MAG TPA: PCRF domain-containing protein, partial [Actinospica sp.]|nr:PCRF domain-containing protein [Actinospica sp.]
MFEAIEELLVEHEQLEARLADPTVHADQGLARKLGKRYAELTPIAEAYKAYQANGQDMEAARELAAEDPSFAEELPGLQARRGELEGRLQELLIPRDPIDEKDVILEIKAGEGGQESMLFAGDLLRMYLRFAERQGWKTELIESTDSDLGGYKDVSLAVKWRGTPQPGEGIWARLKYEGGVHRVQRVPVTESQGRVHTSAAGVLVYPEPEEVAEVQIDESDL